MSEERISRMLAACKDPIRMQILFLLIRRGRTNVGDIAHEFKITRPAISHHLKVLSDAEVLNRAKEGQEVYYWPNSAVVAATLRELADKIETARRSQRKPQ